MLTFTCLVVGREEMGDTWEEYGSIAHAAVTAAGVVGRSAQVAAPQAVRA